MALTNKEIDNFSDQLPEGVKIVDIREQGSNLKDFNVWSFVEIFYPNYHQCDKIAEHSDLHSILDYSWEVGSDADKKYKEIEADYKNMFPYDTPGEREEYRNMIHNEAGNQFNKISSEIYQKAIEGFIEFMKGGQDA